MASAEVQSHGVAVGKGGVSRAAWELVHEALVFDLHIESFLPFRLFGYDLERRHRFNPGYLFGHLDLPRAREHGLNGGMWSLTTNPFRSAAGRWRAFLDTVARVRRLVARSPSMELVKSAADWRSSAEAGRHPVLLSVQGANAVEGAPSLEAIPDDLVVRMTLVHLTPSRIGAPSSAAHLLRRRKGLGPGGQALIEAMNERRIMVDLAHIHRTGFREAVEVHAKDIPFAVTHGGVEAVHRHWRNLNDEEVRAVADAGGVVGVITAGLYLGRRAGASGADRVVDHLDHLIAIGGEDVASIGTDFDGFIIPSAGIRGAHAYPRLVDAMLRRRYSEGRIRKILGLNALRTLAALRP